MPNALAAHESDICDFANRCRALCLQLLGLLALGLLVSARECITLKLAADGVVRLIPKKAVNLGSRNDTTLRGRSQEVSCVFSMSELMDFNQIKTLTQISIHLKASVRPKRVQRQLYVLAPTVITVGQRPCLQFTSQRLNEVVGSLTLLFQRSSQPGLEIRGTKADWSSVPVWPQGTEADPFPPVLVNVGDLLSYWTNGFLRSTVHRVVIPPDGRASDRYSMAYFCHPTNQTRLTPIPSDLVTHAFVPAATANEGFVNSSILTAEEHLRSRLAATYGWEKSTEIG